MNKEALDGFLILFSLAFVSFVMGILTFAKARRNLPEKVCNEGPDGPSGPPGDPGRPGPAGAYGPIGQPLQTTTQPVVFVTLSKSFPTTAGAGMSIVPFDTLGYSNDAGKNAFAKNLFTAPVDGMYLVTFCVNARAATPTDFMCTIVVTPSSGSQTTKSISSNWQQDNIGNYPVNGNQIISLAKGDAVGIYTQTTPKNNASVTVLSQFSSVQFIYIQPLPV